jgi:hypothetical protein
MNALKWLSQTARSIGPYLLVEVLLPGGTLIALLLWLSQHAKLQPRDGLWPLPRRSAPATLVRATR